MLLVVAAGTAVRISRDTENEIEPHAAVASEEGARVPIYRFDPPAVESSDDGA